MAEPESGTAEARPIKTLRVSRPRREGVASRLGAYGALACIFLVALLLRLAAIHDKFLWFDEFLAANLARNPWGKILSAIRVEAHPPLYFVLLKLWAVFFGDGAVAMKSLSLLCGMVALGFLADAVRRTFGLGAAAVAAVLVGLSTVQIDQSTDAKPYAMLSLFLASLLWSLVRADQGNGGKRYVALAAAFAAGATHFYGIAAVLAVGMAVLLAARNPESRKRAAAVLLIGTADALLWVPAALRLPRGAADYIREIWGRVPLWAPLVVSTRISLPGWRKPYPPMDTTMLPQVSIREILAGLIVLLLLVAGTFRRRTEIEEKEEQRFLFAAGLFLLFGFLLFETAMNVLDRPIGLTGRFEVITEMGLALLAARAAYRLGPFARVFVLLLAAVSLWTTVPQWRPHFGSRPIRREEIILGEIRSRLLPGQFAEVVTLGFARPPFDYYAAGDSRIRMISFPASQQSHPGWRESSISAAEEKSLRNEARGLIESLDGKLDQGIPVYIAVRPDPRNDFLLPLLERDHELLRSPLANWFFILVPAPARLAFSGNLSFAPVSHMPKEALWDADWDCLPG